MSELAVRASSWGEIFDCGYRWEGKNLLGMRLPAGLRTVLGSAIHAATAAFDQSVIDGSGVTVDDAAGVLVDKLRDPGEECDFSRDDLTPKEAESIGITLLSRYCREWSPRFEFRYVEMATTPLTIDCGGGVVIRLTGTMDRARVYADSGSVGIKDLKSGARAVEKGGAKTRGHAAQIGTYELLYEHTTGERPTAPAGIIGLKTSGKPEIATGEITGARELMVGTDDHKGLIEFAAIMFRTGLFTPNPSSILCGERYCPRYGVCRYRSR
jgi:hypothetical protein